MRPIITTQLEADKICRQCWQCLLLAAIVFAALAPFDVPIAGLCYRADTSPIFAKAIEVFADVAGGAVAIVVILIAITFIIERRHIRQLPFLLTISLGGGLVVDVMKLCICRARPYTIELSTATFGSTFGGLWPFFSVGSRGQSFPSGHSATAVGFAVALTLLYPRGCWVFAASAWMVMASRVHRHAHFPTDVVAGAIVGLAWALVCHSSVANAVFSWFDRFMTSKVRVRRFVVVDDGDTTLSSGSTSAGESPSNERSAA